jgi:hypothetical protein
VNSFCTGHVLNWLHQQEGWKMKNFAIYQEMMKAQQEAKRAARKAYYKANGTLRGF